MYVIIFTSQLLMLISEIYFVYNKQREKTVKHIKDGSIDVIWFSLQMSSGTATNSYL